MKEYILDAKKNKSLGRLASEAAVLLMGKKEREFNPRIFPNIKVTIINAKEIKISEKKGKEKTYKRYSGYSGGLRITPQETALKKKGIGYVLRKTVMGMLPKNKLRNRIIKNLEVKD